MKEYNVRLTEDRDGWWGPVKDTAYLEEGTIVYIVVSDKHGWMGYILDYRIVATGAYTFNLTAEYNGKITLSILKDNVEVLSQESTFTI